MRISLRFKLATLSLLLLFIPLTGLRFSELIQNELLQSRRETLLFSARAVASALSGRTGLFAKELFHSLNPSRDLYAHPLTNPIRINGKTDDWQPQLAEAMDFGRDNVLFSRTDYDYDSLHFLHLTGIRGDYLYALFIVTDDRIIYRQKNSLRVDQSDHLRIGIEDQRGTLHQYYLTVKKPGWANAFLMAEPRQNPRSLEVEPQIQGMWVETETGYVLELRMPLKMIGQKLAFAIADVDDPLRPTLENMVGTAKVGDPTKLGWLLSPSDSIVDILQSLSRPQARILVVDVNRRIRASHGDLDDVQQHNPRHNWSIRPLLTFLRRLFAAPFSPKSPFTVGQSSTLDIEGVNAALQGKGMVSTYYLRDGAVEIMAATTPLIEGDSIVGAVVVEQTTSSILTLQNQIIEESIGVTILVSVLGGLGLLVYASILSLRIRRLGRQAAMAISDDGHVRQTIVPVTTRDELGDLSRTLIGMLEQLQSHIEYREKMADNLEHEIRTPLAGISASLDNLKKEITSGPATISRYVDWAREDTCRLESLLTAIRDATSLKEALQMDEKEEFDLSKAIEIWLDNSWRKAFSSTSFEYHHPPTPVPLFGDPARIRQMLDKLIENAVSFHRPGTPVIIELQHLEGRIILTAANLGTVIPKELRGQVFNSMVSYRNKKTSTPHLGLGLFIARTIVLHHHGTIRVDTTPNGDGTLFTITLHSPSRY